MKMSREREYEHEHKCEYEHKRKQNIKMKINIKKKTIVKFFFYNVFTKSTGKIHCRYEAPRKEPREAHGY